MVGLCSDWSNCPGMIWARVMVVGQGAISSPCPSDHQHDDSRPATQRNESVRPVPCEASRTVATWSRFGTDND